MKLLLGVALLLSSCGRVPQAPNLPDNVTVSFEPRTKYPFVQNLASYEAQPGDTLYSILLDYSKSLRFTNLADTAAVIQTPDELVYMDSGYSLAVAVEHPSIIRTNIPIDLDPNNPDWVTFGDRDSVAQYFEELKKSVPTDRIVEAAYASEKEENVLRIVTIFVRRGSSDVGSMSVYVKDISEIFRADSLLEALFPGLSYPSGNPFAK